MLLLAALLLALATGVELVVCLLLLRLLQTWSRQLPLHGPHGPVR